MGSKRTLACPYCDHPFDSVPLDRTGCPHCGEIIYVYDSPLRDSKIILTDEGHYKIVKAKAFKQVTDYFTARMLELEAAFSKAKATTSHYAELGRELEALVRNLLTEYLPNKYMVATGFVKTLEKLDWQSSQIDIIISRSDICHPIAVHQQYRVFPIESVISFMEVTSNLTPAKLTEDYEKVAELQRLNNRTYYVPDPPAGIKYYFANETAVHPRFYYFAFSTECGNERISQKMIELSNDYGVQLHALYVLKPSACFFMPNANAGDGPLYKVTTETNPRDAIVGFLQHILISLQTADFIPQNASIPFGAYYRDMPNKQ